MMLRCRLRLSGVERPFVGGEGRELARLVVLVGDLDDSLPDRAGHFGADQLLDRLVLDERSAEEEVDLLDILLAPDLQLLGDRQLAQIRLRVVGEPDGAHVFRMVRHGLEVERPLDLDHVARRDAGSACPGRTGTPLPARRACCRRRTHRTTSWCGCGFRRRRHPAAGSSPRGRAASNRKGPTPSTMATSRRMRGFISISRVHEPLSIKAPNAT